MASLFALGVAVCFSLLAWLWRWSWALARAGTGSGGGGAVGWALCFSMCWWWGEALKGSIYYKFLGYVKILLKLLGAVLIYTKFY